MHVREVLWQRENCLAMTVGWKCSVYNCGEKLSVIFEKKLKDIEFINSCISALCPHTQLQQILLVKRIWSMSAFIWTEHIEVLHLQWDMILLGMEIVCFLTRHTVGSEIRLSSSDEKDHLWVKWIYHHHWSSFKMQSKFSFNHSFG